MDGGGMNLLDWLLGKKCLAARSDRKWTTDGVASAKEPSGHLELINIQMQPYQFHWFKNITSVRVRNDNQTIYNHIFDSCKAIQWVSWIQRGNFSGVYLFNNCTSLNWALLDIGTTSAGAIPQATFSGCTNLETVEFGPLVRSLGASTFNGCSILQTLILRRPNGIVSLSSSNVFSGTPLADADGGVVYLPQVMYDHLGDGSAMDYIAATNWATMADHIKWCKIEGSIYEDATLEETRGVE